MTAADSPLGMGVLSDPDRLGMFAMIIRSGGMYGSDEDRREEILRMLNITGHHYDDRFWTYVL